MRRFAWFLGATLALGAFATASTTLPIKAAHAYPVPLGNMLGNPPKKKNPTPEEQVQAAQRAFDDQDYELAITWASLPANNTGLEMPLRLSALRVLAFSYITLNRTTEAETTVRAIFALDDTFVVGERESPKLRSFFLQVHDQMKKEAAAKVKAALPPLQHVTLRHTPPAKVESGNHVAISLHVDDASTAPSRVVMHVRDAADVDFEEIDLDVDATSAHGTVPARSVHGTVLEYYFVALDDRQRTIGEDRDRDAPYRVPVEGPSRGWVLPVVVGGGILVVGAVLGGLALAGVFDRSTPQRNSTVVVTVTE